MSQQADSPRTKIAKPTILFEDDSIVVLDKPAGVWPREGVFDEVGVYDILAPDKELDEIDLTQVTSLDAFVSGVCLYARTKPAADALRDQFRDARAEIVYAAIVRGPLLQDSGTIERVAPEGPRGENGPSAPIEWRIVDTFVGFAQIECRTHDSRDQDVRQGLQQAGIPLAVDARFGGAQQLMLSSFKAGYHKSRRRPERPLMSRPSLHAARLSFIHPADGRTMEYETPPAKDFRALLNQLDRFGRLPK